VGAAQDLAPGKRNPAIDAKGGEMMTDVDAIKEAEDAKVWEALNKDDPHVKAAVDLLNKARAALLNAESFLEDAAAEVAESPETYRIGSLAQSVEELEIAVTMQVRRF
jgi:hypothetical protein